MRVILVLAAAMLAMPPAPAPACACGTRPGGGALAGATTLGAGTTVVPIRLRGGGTKRPVLVIDGLGYDAVPQMLYKLRLRGRDGRSAALGVINFYDDTRGRFEFEAGEALRRIGGEADAILFEPTSGVTGVAADPEARVRFSAIRVERR